jgi:exodeoxyribonuclease VII large subunit
MPLIETSPSEAVSTGVAVSRGVALSALLAGVAQAVADAFGAGVWTIVEVVEARTRNGHVYLEVSERDAGGVVLAKANAAIWANTASKILPAFEQATGASLAPGIKLLVHARPVYKPQYGFSLEIDAIDPEYTLGDLEARKREIRLRLKQEGLFERNRCLPAPWDFNAVLVIAPQGAAGLGDFQAEANRLSQFGVCQFVYATSRFQGEGAASEIRQTLMNAMRVWENEHSGLPDALVIIRGGGAVNDLAWLNDYDLAKALCESAIPVFTGIGHERDSSVLDEVAYTSFDTPSKVILGIEQSIRQRVEEVKANFGLVAYAATRTLNGLKSHTTQQFESILERAELAIGQGRDRVEERMSVIGDLAKQHIVQARESSISLFREIAGQGPEKTLRRGFAVVRDEQGVVVPRGALVKENAHLSVQFLDAMLNVEVKKVNL